MKIGMILDHEFPVDERVEKEAVSLIQGGFEVHLLSFNFGKLNPSELYKGIYIHRVFMPKALYKKLSALILVLPIYYLFWKRKIASFVREQKIEALHIHDLPLTGAGLKIVKKSNIPIVADMHEDWADWIVNTAHYKTFFGKIIRVLSNWKKYEKESLRAVNRIITVSGPLAKKMISDYNLEPEKVITLLNVPDLLTFNVKESVPKDNILEKKFNIIYCGGIDSLRGLQNVLPLIRDIKSRVKNIQLVIVGDGSYLQSLKKQASELNIQDMVYFTGRKKYSELVSYVKQSQIGIYPQLSYPGIDETLPTKLYQYCAAGIPVISSNHKLPNLFISEHQCGYTVDFENNKAEFIEKVSTLYENPQLAYELGANGKKAIFEQYNWQSASADFINMYTKLSRKQ